MINTIEKMHKEEVEQIQIRMIQHFLYCKRRWGLLQIESQWADNYKTIQGNIVHLLVDDPFFDKTRGNKNISRSVPVFSDKLNIYGIADYIEFTDFNNPNMKVNIVEYKNGEPLAKDKKTVNYADAIQIQAQCLCAEEMFGVNTDLSRLA